MQQNSKPMVAEIIAVCKQDSVLGLWKGTVPTIIRNVPGTGLYFMTLNQLRTRLPQNVNTHFANLSSGMLSRVIVGFVMMPITVIKVRFESDIFRYRSIFGSAKSIISQNGLKGLFVGFGATALRDAPMAGIYVACYERFKTITRKRLQNETLGNAIAGVLGGFIATAATQPFDTIKTRMQLKPEQYPTILKCCSKIYSNEGTRGFYRGTVARLLRKSLASAIAWTVYEEMIKKL